MVVASAMVLLATLLVPAPACSGRQPDVPTAQPVSTSPKTAREETPDRHRGVAIWAETVELPALWSDDRIRGQASSVPAEHREPARAAVRAALDKYPENMLAANLQRVQLVGQLLMDGSPWGGTYSSRAVFIATAQQGGEARTAREIERVFHHEFSSVLLHRHPAKMNWEGFRAHNPAEFEYAGGVLEAARSPGADLLQWNDELAETGFVCRYATLSPEEDFNCIAQLLFMGDGRLRAAIRNNEQLAGKVREVIAFYHAIDPVFTAEFFASITGGRANEVWVTTDVPHATFGVVAVERTEGNEHEVNLVVAVMGSPSAVSALGPGIVAAVGRIPSNFLQALTTDDERSWFVDRHIEVGQSLGMVPGRVVLDNGEHAVAIFEVRIALDQGFCGDTLTIRWSRDQMSLGEASGGLIVGFTQPETALRIGKPR